MKKRKEQKSQTEGQTKARVARRRLPRVPPLDSDVWPQQYRGK
jgi:hypothetical protein